MSEVVKDQESMHDSSSTEKVHYSVVTALQEMTGAALQEPGPKTKNFFFKVQSSAIANMTLGVHHIQDPGKDAKWVISYDDGKIRASAFKRYGTVHEDGSFVPATTFFDPNTNDFAQQPCTADYVESVIASYFDYANFEICGPALDHVNDISNPEEILAYLSLRKTVDDPREKIIAPDLVA
jgi:hypothetical protein